ncbi:MAG: hypothetical protein FJ126_12890 [Deltaproteobacteria bacterium]|nr:hypothetical protein [Deltaproteobacteria bacterium]
MGKSVLYVGLDVHEMFMDVAIAEAGPGAEVRFYGQIGGDLDSLDRVIRKLRAGRLVSGRLNFSEQLLMSRWPTRKS